MEVHQAGGGINFTVEKTRKASEDELETLLVPRLQRMLRAGEFIKQDKRFRSVIEFLQSSNIIFTMNAALCYTFAADMDQMYRKMARP